MSGHRDRRIAELARRQHGVVARTQLLTLGVGRGAIAHRLAEGRLHRIHRGVYLVGHALPPPLAYETAAVLACGEGAFVSHRRAAALWGFLQAQAGDIDITVIGREPGRRPGIKVHRVRRLESGDVTRLHGVLLTAPARTLIDLADAVSERELERSLGDALRRGLVRRTDLDGAMGRAVGRRSRVLRAMLDEGPAFTRSEAEQRLLGLVRAARLPPPECNTRVGPYEVDFLWRDEHLVVEVDGYAFHSTRSAFEQDRRRDADLQTQGLTVMRVTWRQIVHEPEAVVARLAQRLSSRQWR